MMKGMFVLILLVGTSVSWSASEYQRITGNLLHHWNTSSPTRFPWVRSFDSEKLPEGIFKLCLTGIEVGRDSLDLYLLGVTSSTEVPFLLAAGGYRGEHNFAKSYAIYEDDEFCISFQMPFSARYSEGYYRWDVDSSTLVLTRYVAGDPSVESIEAVDSLLAEGEITEAIIVLNNMFYPGNDYVREDMIARLLRSANRVALQAGETNDFQKADEVFQSRSSFLCGAGDSYPIFDDSLDFFSSEFYSHMELDEFVMIMNNHALFP